MSEVLVTSDALWPIRPGARIAFRLLSATYPAAARLGRALPILRVGRIAIVFRNDDVREAFRADAALAAPYAERLAVITGGEPFILGLPDGEYYRDGLRKLTSLLLPGDADRIGDWAEDAVKRRLPTGPGRVEVVSALRGATFEAVARWLGVPEPDGGDGRRLEVWATRLFGFQFGGGGTAPRTEAEALAQRLRDHIQQQIDLRRSGPPGTDDVIGRALARQAAGDAWFTDAAIRTAVLCLLVGGPPQPAMVVPQALDQLLRRGREEAAAMAARAAAAGAGDHDKLRRIVREAMRFDPLAPFLEREAVREYTLAEGTWRACRIPRNATVLVAIASAMQDGRRVGAPARFNPDRPDSDYIHFGHGLHECFGRAINTALLHRLLAPLLRRNGLRRAAGAEGALVKRGVFAERMTIEFGAQAPV